MKCISDIKSKHSQPEAIKSVKKTPLKRLCVFNLVIATLLSWTTMMYLFLPFFNGLLIITIVLILGTIIVASVVFTAGIILLSEGYRNWIGSSWSIVEWLSDVNSNLTKLDIYFPYFAIPAIGFNVLTICQISEPLPLSGCALRTQVFSRWCRPRR